jgi:hypothetical protein
MNFNKITIHLETKGTIIITPVNYYSISDNLVKYVVMYSQKFININPEIPEIETIIPYYISNGGTNKLRANMLYPFMCYSNIEEVDICPFDINRSVTRNQNLYLTILLKYEINNNIDINRLEEDLLNTFLSIYPDLYEESRILRNQIKYDHSKNVNLISVLPRITNLVDFILCIINDVIRDFNYKDPQTQIDIDNGKYRPLSDEQNKQIEYIDLSIFGQEPMEVMLKRDGTSAEFNNHFRLVILTILNKYYKLLVDHHLLDIEPIKLEMETISFNDFNRIVNICNRESAKLNMAKYKIISNKTVNLLINKIDTSKFISVENSSLLKSIIIQTETFDINEDEIYYKSLNKWRSQCLSKDTTIEKKNVFSMTAAEICEELSSYREFIMSNAPVVIDTIDLHCNQDTEKDPKIRLKMLIDRLLLIRSMMISFNYAGQLKIKYTTPDHIEKTVLISVDTSETILTLKTKIYNKVGIVPSHQHLMIKKPYSTIVHLQNDRTIASYNIQNNSELALSIQS